MIAGILSQARKDDVGDNDNKKTETTAGYVTIAQVRMEEIELEMKVVSKPPHEHGMKPLQDGTIGKKCAAEKMCNKSQKERARVGKSVVACIWTAPRRLENCLHSQPA